MKTVLPPLFLCITLSVQAQMGFEKLYSRSGSLRMVETNGHSILFGAGDDQGAFGISELDPSGHWVGTSAYLQGPFIGPTAFRQRAPDSIYFVTGFIDGACQGAPRMFPVVGIMDTVGVIVSLERYEINGACQSLASDLEVTHDKSVITWGWQYDFFALRVDSNLVPVWSKHFGRHGQVQFIRELPCGDLLMGFNLDTAGAAVARLTANGDMVWCKSYFRPSGRIAACIVNSDSSFAVLGVTAPWTSPGQRLFMMQLNADGDVQWCHGYGDTPNWNDSYPIQMVRTKDQQYLISAKNGSRILLMKADINGDSLWTRAIGVAGYGYDPWDLQAASSGGYLLSGIVNGALPFPYSDLVYLFKTDSLGYPPCATVSQISIPIIELFPTDSSFTIASADGVIGFPDAVTDTTFDPATVYDGCLITSLARPEMRHGFQVHPNPTSGHFTVSFPDPLTAESYYAVYDTSGRLLYQRPLPQGQLTEEVDLSRFGKGTYLLKVTAPEGVCYERVVVE